MDMGRHMEGNSYDNFLNFILGYCYTYCKLCNVFCRYSMFTGVIDSREVRREKAASGSQSSGAASCRTSGQDADVARLRE